MNVSMSVLSSPQLAHTHGAITTAICTSRILQQREKAEALNCSIDPHSSPSFLGIIVLALPVRAVHLCFLVPRALQLRVASVQGLLW